MAIHSRFGRRIFWNPKQCFFFSECLPISFCESATDDLKDIVGTANTELIGEIRSQGEDTRSTIRSVSDDLLGPLEYAAGVQEIVVAVGSVDAAIGTVDATLVGGFSAVTTAVAAGAAATSSTVGVEAAQTRDLLGPLVAGLYNNFRIVNAPPNITIRMFRFGSFNNTFSFERASAGPGNDNNIYYGLAFRSTDGSFLTFTSYDATRVRHAGPLFYELTTFQIGSNTPVTAVLLPT